MERLCVDATKIVGNRAKRRWLGAKSLQLRVMQVADGTAPQYRLRQECFPPEGNEATSVEIPGM
jgi:hypothetical protein